MRLIKTAITLSSLLFLASCASAPEAGNLAGTDSATSSPTNRQAAGSVRTHLTLDNQLNDWWGGSGIGVTWRVSDTKNTNWDGDSRPDHAPPKGIQGLEQPANSGPVKTRLEINGDIEIKDFTLTPEITVDGQDFELLPMRVHYQGGWSTEIDGKYCDPYNQNNNVFQYSQKTPRGLLQYEYVVYCSGRANTSSITVRNYQKR